MSLLEKTVEDKEQLYKISMEYFQNIDVAEYENIKFNTISLKSISILIDHDFIPTPCIEIKLELLKDQRRTANYFLYINENKEFVDEFLY